VARRYIEGQERILSAFAIQMNQAVSSDSYHRTYGLTLPYSAPICQLRSWLSTEAALRKELHD
jgi:hypothetical protein